MLNKQRKFYLYYTIRTKTGYHEHIDIFKGNYTGLLALIRNQRKEITSKFNVKQDDFEVIQADPVTAKAISHRLETERWREIEWWNSFN